MDDPGDRERRDGDKGLSGLGKAALYSTASTSLVIAVGAFTALGIWADRKIGWKVPWLTMAGAIVGMTGGMISFFRTVLGKRSSK